MNIYIIGAITSIPDENRPEFERVRDELKKAGHRVFTPHDIVPKADSWEHAMRKCIAAMMAAWSAYREEFGIATLDGWENSKGARIEHDLAVALGIPVKPWQEWLE